MHHVIEHIPDPIRTIQEVHRILKASGALVLATPDFDSGCARLFGENFRLLHDPTHISLFSNESMYRFLRDFGFVIDRVEYPFFETRHFSAENFERLFDPGQISPPFYGNFMTFYCHKPGGGAAYSSYSRRYSQWLSRAEKNSAVIDTIATGCVKTLATGHTLWLYCASQSSWFEEWLNELGLPMIQAAVQAKDDLPAGAGVSEPIRVLTTSGLQNDEQDCCTGDMILAVCPGPLDSGVAAELENLQKRFGLSVGVMSGGEDHAANAVSFDILKTGSNDTDTEGPKILDAISALAATCRELINDN